MPESEIALGRRLTQARKEALIPRAALAVKLGISTNRLYSYETGKAKLPWGVAERACKVLDLHPSWLAGATNHYGVYAEYDLPGLSPEECERAPFTEVYQRFYSPEMREAATDARTKIADVFRGLESALARAKEAGVAPTAAQLAKFEEIALRMEQVVARMLREPKGGARERREQS